jgi:threonylcarbamoyladenosine tRNA methylthiotransferase MtaB
MNKIKIHTLGCRTNKYESQAFLDQLLAIGFELAEDNVDFHVVNTCSVTSSAEKESLSLVASLLLKDSHSKIIITGCSTSSFDDKPNDRIVILPNGKKENLVSLLFPKSVPPPFKVTNFFERTRAFIKIQDGCNSFCSYCIIPKVRGRSKSRPSEEIIEEIKSLLEKDFKEIVLTGINIGDYLDGQTTLADLVKSLNNLERLERLRLSSIDPNKLDEKLLQIILEGKKCSPSLHLSLQSGSDKILKKMNRNYSRDDFISLVQKIKSKNEDFTFTTDVIVGFPGETEIDFKATMEIIKEVGFAKVHMFPFSKRRGTLADKFEDQLPPQSIHERKERLLKVAEKEAFNIRNKFIGRKMRVLLENEINANYFMGHSDNFLKVKVDLKKLPPETLKDKCQLKKNMMVEVFITENSQDGLIGCLR